MRTFKTQAAQGDLLIRRIDALPEDLQAVAPKNGRHVLAHSETGHDHIVLDRPGVALKADPVDQFRAFLIVEGGPVDLEHKREFDTHETLRIEPGLYEIRRQREYTPEGFRRVAD